MAKRKQIFVDVVVDDKGTTQRLAVDSDKLEKALRKNNKAGLDTQRQLRGTADMSSNVTKNFGKMAQGISGGIVPAYAELAARVFAVTAAFRFLQEAADTRNLIAGQEQLGAVMGTNLAGITRSLQEATAGQLKFKDAAQATAIGTAAGLTSNQLEGLATAAKNVSFALGRDLTDSFNRLIRGVTKAEPELLDELGIILRLKPATELYANQLGKAADDLTAFERSQAVANFVLEEADRKFSKISQVMDEDAFAVSQFGKVFDDLMNSMKVGIANVLTPVLQFLSNNVGSLVSLFGLLALPLVRSVLPNLDKFSEAAGNAATNAGQFAEKAQGKFNELTKETRVLGKTMEEVSQSATDLAKGAGVTGGKKDDGTGMSFLAGKDDSKRASNNAKRILDGAQKQMDNAGKITTGKLKGYNKQQLADLQLSYQQRTQVVKKFETKTRMSMKGIALTAKQTAAGIQVSFAKAFASISRGATLAAKGVDRAFKAAGIIGLIMLFVDLGKMAFDALFPMSTEAKRAQDEVAKLTEKTEELATHLAKVNELRADIGLLDLNEATQQFGNAIQEANLGGKGGLIDQINTLDTRKGTEGFKEYKASLVETANQMAAMDPRFEALVTALDEETTVKGAKGMLEFANSAVGVSKAMAQMENNQKAVDQEINNVTKSIAKKPFESLITALEKDMEAKVKLVADFDQEGFDRETAKIEAERKRFAEGTDIKTEGIFETQTGFGGFLTRKKVGTKTTKTQTAEDIKEEERLNAVLQAREDMKAANEAAAEKAKRITEFAIEQQTKALAIDEKIFKNKEDVLKIDQISQTFDAKKARLKTTEINQDTKIQQAKQKVLETEIALRVVKENGAKEGSDELENAQKAVDNAERQVGIEETILSNIERQNQFKAAQLAFDEARLKTTKAISDAENALARAKIAQGTAVTPGAGTQGKSFLDVEREKRENNINNIISQRGIIDKKIADAQLVRGSLNLQQDAAKIQAQDQLIERLRIEGEQLDANLTAAQQFVLTDIERVRLQLERGALETEAISLNPVRQAFEERLLQLGIDKNTASKEELQTIYDQTEALQEQEILQKGLKGVVDSIQGGMEQGLMSIVDGTKSAKEAFADFAKGVLKSIAQMIIKMMVFNALKSIGMPGFKDGGISKPKAPGARYGGIMDSYSTGGIARGRQAGYPVMLHGTEAVVPLPNKKEIPVEIRGGTGNQNNISISVATDGTTKTEGDTGNNNQAAQLGRVVSMAVQDELHKQKRPGGILSPFGAA